MNNRIDRRSLLAGLLGSAACAGSSSAATDPAGASNVRSFGAAGDGARLDTPSLQAAIDACGAAGGGTVLVPPGAYLTGTLFLRSRVVLHLTPGAVLRASLDLTHYPPVTPRTRSYTDRYENRSLIYGEDLDDIAVTGGGVIDGRGAGFLGGYKERPSGIRIVSCRGVTFQGVTLRNSPAWMQHYLACDRLTLRDLTVETRRKIQNNDGVDIDSCQDVVVSGCRINCGDDALCLKSTLHRPCRNVVISDCVVSGVCNGIKFGTESIGGFENIAISNCVVQNTCQGGISLATVDGGNMTGISVANVIMDRVGVPIFLRLGARGRRVLANDPPEPVGQLRDVTIRNVVARAFEPIASSLTGLPGHELQNITIEDVRLHYAPEAAPSIPEQVPERPAAYPEYRMLGDLPAFGLYCRHIRNLVLRNIELSVESQDARPALWCEDVRGLDLFAARLAPAPGVRAAAVFRDVVDALVHGCRSPRLAGAWLEVAAGSSDIALRGNELSRAAAAVRRLAPDGSVRLLDGADRVLD
jgi:hypothetical protein